MTKQEELLKRIQQIKHDFTKLVPTTIELMFDACLGILFEDHAQKVAKLQSHQSMRDTLLRQNADAQLKHDKELVLYLKQRVTSIYTEVKSESEKNKEEGGERAGQSGGPGEAPTDGEAGPGRGEAGA